MPAALSFAQFQKTLVRGRIDAVYLLEGDESFFHEEAIRLLSAAVQPEGSGGVDRDVLRGPEASLAGVLDAAATFPMAGERRLIVVREADGLRCESADDLKAYLADPNPRTCLVFSAVRLDRRRSFWKALQAGCVRVDCTPLSEARLTRWIVERLRGRGYGVGDELAEAIGAAAASLGLARLDGELEKLMSSVGAPRPIEPADLEILAGVPRLGDAFSAARQMIRGERAAAIGAVRDLLRAGEEPLLLLGGFSWYVRTALKARSAAGRRLPPRETTMLYGLDPGRIERFNREVGSSTPAQLREALRLCLRADREIKGGGSRNPAHALERLIHRVGRLAGTPA